MVNKPLDTEAYPAVAGDPYTPMSHVNIRAFRDWIANQMWARYCASGV